MNIKTPLLNSLITATIAIANNSLLYANSKTIDLATVRDAIPFIPLKPEDFNNPVTGKPYKIGETIKLEVDGKIKFQGLIQELLLILNDAEKYYNEKGISLKGSDPLKLINSISEHKDLLNDQYLQELKLRSTVLKDKIKDSIKNCDLLNISKLGINAKTNVHYFPTDKIDILEGVGLNADEFINRINEQQKFLCSIGYDMLSGMNSETNGVGVVDWIMNKRQSFLSHLGISKYNHIFNMASINKIKDYAQFANDIKLTIEAGKFPSPEKLQQLRLKLNADILPAEFQIPEMPNIPSPTIPKRSELALKKGKKWDFFEGSKDVTAAYANAFYEVRGDESNQDVRGEGKVGIWALGNELNFLYAAGAFSVGSKSKCIESQPEKSGACAFVKMTAFGQDLFTPIDAQHEVSYHKQVPEAWKWQKNDIEYSQSFTIGPVPVNISANLLIDMSMGYEVGLVMTKAYGKVLTSGGATVVIKGGVGVSGLQAGASGKVLLIKGGPELYGESLLAFDQTGVPFLTLKLDADFNYRYLDGKIQAFIEYPWFECSWSSGCKTISKEETRDLWNWEGRNGSRKIMNWGMQLNPFGAKLSGDLVDQTDEEETKVLAERLSLEQRKISLANLEKQIIQKSRVTFESIANDLNQGKNLNIEKDGIILQTELDILETERRHYLNVLAQLIENNRG